MTRAAAGDAAMPLGYSFALRFRRVDGFVFSMVVENAAHCAQLITAMKPDRLIVECAPNEDERTVKIALGMVSRETLH